ncbi:hypothetical protein PGTUg99_009527 [Puccinia graminis f. sp. tritici]|uniref:Uncharacterized protein n=1 Tax=Puccinia graminis f. sp. tritici TaxID=56615 RepID=A0A5B0LUG6_PUCGR|nr:hypothetical protein PGTUg99_009527 [Puccinia graminis f. sp. tritici]
MAERYQYDLIPQKENPRRTFIYANSLLLDHLISTLYLVYFGIEWYFKNPHDGRREAHGDAQKNMMNPDAPRLSPELRKQAAQAIWKEEQGFASGILGLVWLTKLYFIFVVYSFALHLRRGTYTALPLSRPPSTISTSTRLRGVSRSLNPNSSAYTYSQLRNPNGTLPLASPSSSDLPVFRPQLDDIHPLEIQSVPTELSLNPGKLS